MNSAYGFVRALSLDLGTLSGLIARSGVRSVNDSKLVSGEPGDDLLLFEAVTASDGFRMGDDSPRTSNIPKLVSEKCS